VCSSTRLRDYVRIVRSRTFMGHVCVGGTMCVPRVCLDHVSLSEVANWF
jgi:hypothetical protein